MRSKPASVPAVMRLGLPCRAGAQGLLACPLCRLMPCMQRPKGCFQ
jgi:hypothetical protein